MLRLVQIWRVYQRGLEHWLADLLQPVFDGLVEAGSVPRFVRRLRILEFTVDHEAPYFTNMRRRTSRKVGGQRGTGGGMASKFIRVVYTPMHCCSSRILGGR